jgi:hypothetical protein
MMKMMEAIGWLYAVALFWPVGVPLIFLADWLDVTRIVSWAWRRTALRSDAVHCSAP